MSKLIKKITAVTVAVVSAATMALAVSATTDTFSIMKGSTKVGTGYATNTGSKTSGILYATSSANIANATVNVFIYGIYVSNGVKYNTGNGDGSGSSGTTTAITKPSTATWVSTYSNHSAYKSGASGSDTIIRAF